MTVSELIDMLRDQPPDAEVELAVIAPVDDESEDITVDRYSVEGMLPWNDVDEDDKLVIWLVGGEDDDVEAFLDAIEHDDDDDDDHDHEGHDHEGHEHGAHEHHDH
jgi:hypothetical protein